MKRRNISIFLLLVVILAMNVVAAPLASALDTSNKVKVEVYYNAYDEDYIKNIVLDDGTAIGDLDYEIIYMPVTYGNTISQYFNYAAWITRDGLVSLSVDPVYNIRHAYDYWSGPDKAFDVLSSPTAGFGSSAKWKNTTCMEWQFQCHFNFAKTKSYWNLEPSRTAKSYSEVVLASCNPE